MEFLTILKYITELLNILLNYSFYNETKISYTKFTDDK